MDVSSVVEQVQQVSAVRAADSAEREQLEAATRGIGRLESWLAGTKAAITTKLSAQVSFPEKTIADGTRSTTRDAINDTARAGGRTNLANLLPVCTHHHTKIHDGGWIVSLGPNRELNLRFPDGTIHNTGPPTRQTA